MKEKSKKMKPFAFISIMFSLLLVVSVGYFWIGKSADKSRGEDAVGVSKIKWTAYSAQNINTYYYAAVDICRQVENPIDTGQGGHEYKGWHNCKRGSYTGITSDLSVFDFDKNPDWKQGAFYVHIVVVDGNGRYALPTKYYYDPNGETLVLDSYGQTLTGDKRTYICTNYVVNGSNQWCQEDSLPTGHDPY